MNIRVYIAERQKIIRDGLKAFLRDEADIKIVAECELLAEQNMQDLVYCEVLLLEFFQDLVDFLKQVRLIKKRFPGLKIIALTGDDANELGLLQTILEGGVSGYLTKDASREELVHSIRKVNDDGYYVCTAFVMRMMKNPAYFRKKVNTIELKEAEQEVLNLVAEGLTNNDIAQRLFISVRTVESRRNKLLEKTGTTNTATLVRFAVEHGLLS